MWKKSKEGKMNKKAAEVLFWSLGASVLMVVAIIIVVAFYDMQTGKFSAFIKDVVEKNSADTAVALCNNLVSRQASYEYCCARKEVRYEDNGKTKIEQMTCGELSTRSFGSEIEKMDCNGIC